MREAKSMYFGGDIVSAEECDYSSYERLGLKCPFCNFPVFLRAASTRKIKDVEKPIVAYFAHFPSTGILDLDCEARSVSKIGREKIEQIKTEARNQRLQLYNEKLWQIVSTDRGIPKEFTAFTKKNLGERWIDNFTKILRKEITTNLPNLFDAMELATKVVEHIPGELFEDRFDDPTAQIRYEALKEYAHKCDKRLHLSICHEVLQFLCTSSGTWTLTKLVTISPGFYKEFQTMHPSQAREKIEPTNFAITLAYFLTSVHWAETIDRFNNQK